MTHRNPISTKFLCIIGILFCLANCKQRSNSREESILGQWEIDSLIVEPISIPSYCDLIFEGSILNFKTDDQLIVTPKDSTQNCNSYSYKVYENELSIREYDMLMSANYELTHDGYLKLNSRNLFDWDNAKVPDEETYNLLIANGITVKLKRKDDNNR